MPVDACSLSGRGEERTPSSVGSSPFQPVHRFLRRLAIMLAIAALAGLMLSRPAHAADVSFAEMGEWVSDFVSVLFTGIGALFLELTRRRSNTQEQAVVGFGKSLVAHQKSSQEALEAHRKEREAGLAAMRRMMDDLRDRMVRRDELDAAERRHKDRMSELREEHRASQNRSDQRFAAIESQLGQLSGRVDQLHKQAVDTHKTVSEVNQQLGRLAEAWGAQ